MMKTIFTWFTGHILLGLWLCSACSSSPEAAAIEGSQDQQLTIYAAASLIEAFTELSDTFEAMHTSTEVVISYAGSQQIAQQLSQGAPGDLFASANDKQIKNVIRAGRVDAGDAQVFVHNQLAVIVPADNPGQITTFEDIARSGLQVILADASVPVGAYSQQMLDRADQQLEYDGGFKFNVLENVVSYEENVKAVVTKVVLGEADAGIAYVSDASGVIDEELRIISIPGDINITASYYLAPLNDSTNLQLAQEFISFVLSPAGQEILGKHGFMKLDAHEQSQK